MSDDLGQVGVVNALGTEVGNVAVATLVGTVSNPEASWAGFQRSR